MRLEVCSANALLWAVEVAEQVKAGDVVRGPYADAAESPIHEADIAAVAAVALTSDGHAGATYRLTGPESLTHREQVRLIGEAIGRPLRYEELSPEVARRRMSPHAPVDVLFEVWAAHVGRPAPVTDAVEKVTGRPARTFAQWAVDHAADFR